MSGLRRLLRRLAVRLGILLRSVEGEIDSATLPAFANRPSQLRIASPRQILNASCIRIGDHVSLGPGCLLNAIRRYPGAFMSGGPETEPQQYDPAIVIGSRVSATGHLTIGAADSVTIEDDVLIAGHVFISDNQHGIGSVDVPFKYQPLERIAPVRIGRGTWLGEHVVVLAGVTIGEMCIIGANSVVTRSIPPRSIAVGAPARVVRRWDEGTRAWQPAARES